MKNLVLTLTFSFCYWGVFSQMVNSEKITVNEFYNGDTKDLKISPGKGELQIPVADWEIVYSYLSKKKDLDTSAVKKNVFFLDIGLTNVSKQIKLTGLNVFEKNGFNVGVTYQHSFQKIFLKSDEEGKNPLNLTTWTLALKYQRDNFSLFDTLVNEAARVYPNTFSLKFGISKYLFKFKSEKWYFKNTYIPSFYLNSNIVGYNSKELLNYLELSNFQSYSTLIATSNSSFDGKWGQILNKRRASGSFSLPVIPFYKTLGLVHLAPTPHITLSYIEGGNLLTNTGFSLGFLSKGIVGKEEKGDKKKYHDFVVPSFLSLGVDWSLSDDGWKAPVYFLAGSVKF